LLKYFSLAFQRPFVHDDDYKWEVPLAFYDPIEYTSAKILAGPAYADHPDAK
jgi:hypothetical protein